VDDGKERILIVDDDQSLLALLTRTLARSGYEVVSATDGFQALEAIQAPPGFSVMLTDLYMPGMSGVELIQRAAEIDPAMEVIVITAADSLEAAIQVIRQGGVYDYLQKPLDSLSDLPRVIERAATHRRLVVERAALQLRAETETRHVQALLSAIGEVVLAASADGLITLANPAAVRVFNQPDLVGANAYQVLPFRLVEIIHSWMASGSSSPAVLEIPWVGDTVQMVSLTPLRGESQGLQGWALVMRDITPFKQLDELKAQATLDAISKIRRPLAEAMGLLVELNVLAIQEDRIAEKVYQLIDVWKRIQTYGDELVRMAQQQASHESRITEVNLQQTLADIEQALILEMYWQNRGSLSLKVNGSLPTIQTDAELLHKLLKGLVKRAALRNPLGGGIQVSARQQNGRVYIEVSDEGPSITDTGLLHMFDKSVLESALEGSTPGMELSRAQALLAEVGGQLWVGGETRRGSLITICLPTIAQWVDRKAGRSQTP
jgi:CheY-like chemotaxis protein